VSSFLGILYKEKATPHVELMSAFDIVSEPERTFFLIRRWRTLGKVVD
jgi:hypothetical protein